MKANQVSVKDDKFENIEFKDVNELIFPKICLICGKNTESTYQKTLYSKFIPEKSFRNNYFLSLPICKECLGKIRIKSGFQNMWIKLLPVFGIVGIIIMSIIILSTYSILMGISASFIFFIIPILFYQRAVKDKIKLDKFFKLNLVQGEQDILKISILNKNYASFLKKTNLN